MLDCVLVVSGTSSHNLHSIFITHTHKLSQVQLYILSSPRASHLAQAGKKDGCQGRNRGPRCASNQAPDACIISCGGGFLCSAGPQQVKGGTGLVGNVERGYDLARPGSWHEPIHAEDAPLKTRSLKKLPPKTHSSRLEAQDH